MDRLAGWGAHPQPELLHDVVQEGGNDGDVDDAEEGKQGEAALLNDQGGSE